MYYKLIIIIIIMAVDLGLLDQYMISVSGQAKWKGRQIILFNLH